MTTAAAVAIHWRWEELSRTHPNRDIFMPIPSCIHHVWPYRKYWTIGTLRPSTQSCRGPCDWNIKLYWLSIHSLIPYDTIYRNYIPPYGPTYKMILYMVHRILAFPTWRNLNLYVRHYPPNTTKYRGWTHWKGSKGRLTMWVIWYCIVGLWWIWVTIDVVYIHIIIRPVSDLCWWCVAIILWYPRYSLVRTERKASWRY